ncbi:YlcI/YnfO family protein [Vibrio sp. PNB22_4_1]
MQKNRHSKNTNRCSQKKYIRFEHELITEIEAMMHEGESFSAWVKSACIEKLEHAKAMSSNLDIPSSNFNTAKAWITTLAQQGWYHQQIADFLNEQQLLTSDGKPWTRLGVKRFIDS